MLKGERCFLPKCAIVKRNYPPGFHGPKGAKKLTEYATQLMEKQKAKRIYNLYEKQFRLTFEKAKKSKAGSTGENLLKFLELRLDNVVYRLGLASSRNEARQLVSHGHFTVNGKRADIASYLLKEGNVVKVKDNSKKIKEFKKKIEDIKRREVPGWINFDAASLTAKILHNPKAEDLPAGINSRTIVEFYSK